MRKGREERSDERKVVSYSKWPICCCRFAPAVLRSSPLPSSPPHLLAIDDDLAFAKLSMPMAMLDALLLDLETLFNLGSILLLAYLLILDLGG